MYGQCRAFLQLPTFKLLLEASCGVSFIVCSFYSFFSGHHTENPASDRGVHPAIGTLAQMLWDLWLKPSIASKDDITLEALKLAQRTKEPPSFSLGLVPS